VPYTPLKVKQSSSYKDLGKYQTTRQRMQRLGMLQAQPKPKPKEKKQGGGGFLGTGVGPNVSLGDVGERIGNIDFEQAARSSVGLSEERGNRPGGSPLLPGQPFRLGAPSELQGRSPAEAHLQESFRPYIPESANPLSRIPGPLGDEAAKLTSGMTSPAAIAMTLAGGTGVLPALGGFRPAAYSVGGGILGGTAGKYAEKAGVGKFRIPGPVGLDVGPAGVGELLGGFYAGPRGIRPNLGTKEEQILGLWKQRPPSELKPTRYINVPKSTEVFPTEANDLVDSLMRYKAGTVDMDIRVAPPRPDMGKPQGYITIDIHSRGKPSADNMVEVLHISRELAQANPGYRIKANVVNDRLMGTMRKLGLKGVDVPSARDPSKSIGANFDLSFEDLDEVYQRLPKDTPGMAGLVEGEDAGSAAQKAREVLDTAGTSHWSAGQVTSRAMRQGTKSLTQAERSTLLNANAGDAEATAALEAWLGISKGGAGRVTDEAALRRAFDNAASAEPPTPRGVMPSREELVAAWEAAGYRFTPETVPDYLPGGALGTQPGLLPDQPAQPGLSPGTTGAITPTSQPELIPGMGRQGEAVTPPLSNPPPLYPTHGEQGYFPGMGSSMEYQPRFPEMEPPPTPPREGPFPPGKEEARGETIGLGLYDEPTEDALRVMQNAIDGEPIGVMGRRTIAKYFGKDVADKFKKGSVLDEVLGLLNLPRAFLATGDASGTYRQAGLLNIAHPELAARMLKTQWRALTEDGALAVEQRIAKDPYTQKMLDNGLHLTSFRPGAAFGGLPTEKLQEESYLLGEGAAGRFVRSKPILRQSERAYVTGLNDVRHGYVKNILSKWEEAGDARFHDPKALKSLMTWANHATGRGLSSVQQNAALSSMNAVFFSPRLLASRVQTWADLVTELNKAARGQSNISRYIAEDMAKTYSAGIAALTFLSATGVAKTNTDPRSTQFGKAKFGSISVDMFGGSTPMMRLIALGGPAALKKGTVRTQAGELVDVSLTSAVEDFLRSKLSPVAGAGVDIYTGRSAVGEKVGVKQIPQELLANIVPLIAQDTYEAVKEEGIKGAAVAPLAFVGGTVSISPKTARTQFLETFKEKHPEINTEDKSLVNLIAADDPELSALLEKSRAQALERGSESGVTMAENAAFFKENEDKVNLLSLAKSLKSGNAEAGPAFAEAYKNYEKGVVEVLQRQFFGKESDAAVSPIGQALEQYRQIEPEFLPEENSYDWETYFTEKDKAFARLKQLNPDTAHAIENKLRTVDPTVQQVELQFKNAKKAFHTALGMNKWKDNIANQDIITQLHKDAQFVNQQLALAGRPNASVGQIWKMVAAANPNVDPQTLRMARRLRPGTKYSLRQSNPEREQYLIDNYLELSVFFPTLYRSEKLLRKIGKKYGRAAINRQLLQVAPQIGSRLPNNPTNTGNSQLQLTPA